MSRTLAFDTSNYTTSAAVFDGAEGENAGRLLDVPAGALGLRQSDALFAHVKRLPALMEQLKERGLLEDIVAVGASTAPREVEGSYMPCFLAGQSQGEVLAAVLGVPFFGCSHQQGHLAAAAWSAGRLDLLDEPFLAWHLSGGTTELLYVEPDGVNVRARAIGGTSDISAGQLIDRTGQLLGLPFPAGKALDALVKELLAAGEKPANVARFAIDTVVNVVLRATGAATERYPGLPVLCSGGVASNSALRAAMTRVCGALFAQPRYSTDNAMGVAILAHRQWKERQS